MSFLKIFISKQKYVTMNCLNEFRFVTMKEITVVLADV